MTLNKKGYYLDLKLVVKITYIAASHVNDVFIYFDITVILLFEIRTFFLKVIKEKNVELIFIQ